MILWKTGSHISFPCMTEGLLDFLLLLSTTCHDEGKELYIDEAAAGFFTVRTRDWTPNQVNRLATKYFKANSVAVDIGADFRWVKFTYDNFGE
jgi:hypothetical protein